MILFQGHILTVVESCLLPTGKRRKDKSENLFFLQRLVTETRDFGEMSGPPTRDLPGMVAFSGALIGQQALSYLLISKLFAA